MQGDPAANPAHPQAGRPGGPPGPAGANIPPGGAGDARAGQDAEDQRRIVAQYNVDKVGSMETAKHIIQILHLLPNSRERMLGWIETIPDFELRASRELETGHVPLPNGWQQREREQRGQGGNGPELRPLRVRFGVLQSDFRDGVAKFFNRNPVDCVAML